MITKYLYPLYRDKRRSASTRITATSSHSWPMFFPPSTLPMDPNILIKRLPHIGAWIYILDRFGRANQIPLHLQAATIVFARFPPYYRQ